ncbi:MAG: alpha-2-macroglobulin [Treponema sp.]|jgi:uncharacterized protein YfaS (alpha-2-macroglobulin family)|nr:alpha-2-macroglobulin [Treponema sp.]
MKKRIILLIILAATVISASCDKKADNEELAQPVSMDQFVLELASGGTAINAVLLANDAAIEAAFTLDYRPQKAEAINEAESLSAEALAGGATGSGQGTVLGGGLRRLTDYQTVYFNPTEEKSRIEAIRLAQEAGRQGQLENADAGPLTVIDWGPRGNYSSTIQRPSIYVIFSQPMVALASLGEQSNYSPVVSISPAIKGTFRWYGTGFLSFEGEEPCQSQQTYTITVADNARSMYGTVISGDRTFTFLTETLSIRSVNPGEEFRKTAGFNFDNRNVPPEAARQISLEFNYPVEASDIGQYLEISAGNVRRNFTLRQETEYKVIASLNDPVGFETQVTITLKSGAKSRGGSRGTEADRSYSFSTPGAFRVTSHRRIPGYGRYNNLVELSFSHALNISTVQRALRTDPAMPIGPDNIEVWGSTVRIYNLPVSYSAKFKVLVDTVVEDIYGRRLSAAYSGDVVVPDEPPPEGEARYLDYGHAMLEAQFPPRFLFEYKNIANNSWYQITGTRNPWAAVSNIPSITLTPGRTNARYFEEIDLSPFLNAQGRGFVSFRAELVLPYIRSQRNGIYVTDTRTTRNELNIQVTDLGMTVRYAFNKAVVLVTSLSTGKPVQGAKVRLLSPSSVKSGADISSLENLSEAVTDSNGFAVLTMNASVLRDNTRTTGYQGYETPFVMAEKDGDRAVFAPSSHNIWSFGISSLLPQRAEEITARTFMFSDRGLYKPGEVLTFRGVDRSKVLGMYAIYQGDYFIDLEEDVYRPTPVAGARGTTTESGSFHGTIQIPDDLKPGAYRLVYRRNNNTIIANVPITIAYFERLRFQASISAPATAIISGDDINLNLRASYLSGGSLSGASWESAWYEEMSVFNPGRTDTRGFTFGPRGVWDSKRHIASESGMLSGDGTASLSQKTSSGRITGAAYLYQAEARVTDISNQMISAYRSVLVHPASFYIGLRRSGSGFARSGQEINFDYITVNTNGEKTSGNSLFLQNGEEAGIISVELIREEWRRVQQRGVNGYIYDEYSREYVTDSSQKVALGSGATIKVRPSAAGFYTLRVTAKDREGRTALTELNFYVTGAGGGYWNMGNPNEIRLTPDQDIYEPGDTAKVLMQSTLPEGYYLITVEREGIFTEEVRHFTEPFSVIDVPIARNYVPVVYVTVSSYSVRSGPPTHEYGSPDLDKPKGYFGATRLRVDPRVRAFSVKVENDKATYRPGEEVTMTLTATKDGRPLADAELCLMAVDRGVLDLINYHVPDPISYFYAENLFPLAVYGGDSRAWLMDPVTYNVTSVAGGDGEDSKIEERKDFNPTAVFEPMLITDANGKVTCKFRLPDNLTTYRVTVFGVRGDMFALKETEIAAQNRINVREVQPRRLRERDTAETGVLITNLDSVSHTLTVRLDIGAPLSTDDGGRLKAPGTAFVDGIAERRVTVRSGENAVVYFDVAAVKEGYVSLNFTINSNILNERLISEMVIEHPYVMETVTTTGTLSGDTGSEGLVIPSFADNGMGSLSLILDATRLGLLDSAITYLFRYPYGCLEQRSAAIFPLVIFGEYLDSLNLRSEVSNPQLVVENELKSWANLQLSDGGFPYWPSYITADFYVSLRIAHIIAIAQAKGLAVPSSLNIEALWAYLDRAYQAMQGWRISSTSYYYQSYLQSYMLYVKALSGRTVDASRLAEILGRDNVDPSVLAYIGMAYRALGRNTEAANTAQRLRNLIRMTVRGADISDPLDRYRYIYYGNKVEQLALTLQFFVDQYPGDDINGRLLFSLLENKRSGAGYWENTAATVRVLSAVDALIRAENLVNLDAVGTVSLAGTELLSGTFRGLGAKAVTGTYDFRDPVLANLARDRLQSLDFTRRGNGNIYYTASLSYAIPSELLTFRDEGLGVFLTIYDVNTGQEVSGTSLVSGRTYRGVVRVSSGRDRTYVALRVPVPSGAEILDAAFVTTASYSDVGGAAGNNAVRNSSRLSHRVIMDNEVQFFWDQFYKGESTVSFLFRAVRRGVYPTPPVQAECMYEEEIFGRSQGLIYTIE